MAKTNHCFTKPFKAGKAKQRAAEKHFLQAVQNWYAKIPVEGIVHCESYSIQRTAQYSDKFPELHMLLYWYTYGFDKGVVTIDFEWFKRFAKGSDVRTRFEPARESRSWHRRVRGPDPSTKYSKKKSEKMPDARREELAVKGAWRKKKKKRSRYNRRGPGSDYKAERASRHRSFCKQAIRNEHWGAFHQRDCSQWEYKRNVNPRYTWA